MSHLKESLILSFTRHGLQTDKYELIFPVVTPFTLLSGLSSSTGWYTGGNPSSNIDWIIREEITEAAQIGTITLTTAGAVTFTFTSTKNINIGDVITITSPSSTQTATGSIGVSIVGER